MARSSAGDGGVQVGVGQHDVGRLAAQFQRDFFEVALSGGRNDQAADLGGAGESDLVDARMGGQGRAGRFAQAGDDIDDALGEARFLDQFA